jgi:hypothetical protein
MMKKSRKRVAASISRLMLSSIDTSSLALAGSICKSIKSIVFSSRSNVLDRLKPTNLIVCGIVHELLYQRSQWFKEFARRSTIDNGHRMSHDQVHDVIPYDTVQLVRVVVVVVVRHTVNKQSRSWHCNCFHGVMWWVMLMGCDQADRSLEHRVRGQATPLQACTLGTYKHSAPPGL